MNDKYNTEIKSHILKNAYQCLYYIKYPNLCNQPVMEYPLYRHYLNRKVFDMLFSGNIKNGNQIEFFDKLYSIDEVINRIPLNFNGTIDLTICNSVIFGEEIKRLRRNCLVIVNQEPADPIFRVTCYRYLLEILNKKNTIYIEAYALLRKMLMKKFWRY